MKKLFLLTLMVFAMVLSFGGLAVVSAEEIVEEQEVVETVEVESLEDTEELTKQITEYVIAGVLGLFGTSALAIVFRRSLKSLALGVVNGIKEIKTNKTDAETSIKKLKEDAENTLASLKMLKDEISEQNKEEFETLKTAILCLATGIKELIVNGTSEKVSNILKLPNKEVGDNGSEEV